MLNKSSLQQIQICPDEPLIRYLKTKNSIITFGGHQHHTLVEYLLTKKWKHDYIIIQKADGKCLHVIEALGLWLWYYQNGEKDLPKLILIGREDFELPSYANFTTYEQPRTYDREIVTHIQGNWYTLVNENYQELNQNSILALVVPSKDNLTEYKSKLTQNVTVWPKSPPKSKGIYIVPGEFDEWLDNVQTIIDFGMEVQKRLSPFGGEEEYLTECDQKRIENRFEWLGLSRKGKHIRLFETNDLPQRNPLPAERRSIYALVSSFRARTPEFTNYLRLIPKSRIESTLRVLDATQFPTREPYLSLPYAPRAIQLIQNYPRAEAFLVASLMNTNDFVVAPIAKSPLESLFRVVAEYLEADNPKKWLEERPTINRVKLEHLLQDYDIGMDSFGLEERPVFTVALHSHICQYFTELQFHSGNTYRSRRGDLWIVDMSSVDRENLPKKLYALSWQIDKEGRKIVKLWC